MTIKQLTDNTINKNIYTYDGLSYQELLSQFFQKINECIKECNSTNEMVEFMINEGIPKEIANQLITMYTNGQLGDLINNNLLKNINDDVENLKSNKMDRDTIIGYENLSQEVKEGMSDGSVPVVGVNSVQRHNIVDKQVNYIKTNFLKTGKNKMDKNTLSYGFYVDGNGILKSSSTYVTTDYIPVSIGNFITLNRISGGDNQRRDIRKICFYDGSYNPQPQLHYDNSNNTSESVEVTDSSTKYVRVSFNKGYVDNNTILHLENTILPIEPFYYKIDSLLINDTLVGKSIVGFGDSIMRGAGNDNVGIVDLLGQVNKMVVENRAVSGATILKETTNNIPMQVENQINTNVDYVIFDGYINDCQIENIINKLGDVSLYYSSNYDTSTLCGQLEDMLRYTLNKFTKAKIIYIMVHTMNSRDNEIVKKVHEKVKLICKKWGVAIVDLYEEGGLNTYITHHRTNYTSNSDGTHPNLDGYLKYYIPMINNVLQNI